MAFDWRVLLSALSSAAPEIAQMHSNRRAQDELNRGRADIQGAQAQADRAIGDEVMSVAHSTPDAERKSLTADYAGAVRKARLEGNASTPSLGGARFRSESAAATSAGAAYGNQQADLGARIDAPRMQRQREAEGAARASMEIPRARSRASSADYLSRMRAQRAAQGNPWLKLLAALGGQIANNYQTKGERGPLPAPALQEIDMSTLPQRLSPPRRIPAMRQMPPWEG